jgi:PAS domain S-box-containing protein
MDALPTTDRLAPHESRLLALCPDLLGAAGFDGRLKLHNPAWSRTLGWSEQHLREKPWLELIHPDDRERIAGIVGALADGAPAGEFTCRVMREDASDRCVLWSVQASGPDSCLYLSGKDITDRQRLEDELAARADMLERTNAELQEFAYIASHDLAEPLRMITSYLELLQRRYGGQLDETADEFIGYAIGGADRLKKLIDDLLTYSRVGSRDLEPAEVELDGLLAMVVQGLGPAIEDAGATLDLRAPLGHASGDPTQLAQLLQNLITNAIKFHVPERPPIVSIATEADGDGVRIDVADDGIGIAAGQHERIFKMFARLHGRDEYQGTGIGLPLCRRIVERHGGRLWLDSEPGAGSTFHVWLPRA